MTYHCQRRAVRRGFLRDVYTSGLLQSTYQLDKYVKHAHPPTQSGWVSIFCSTSPIIYMDYVVCAASAGAVEISPSGRRNFIRVAGHRTGFSYQNGVLVGPTDGVRLVLSSEADRVHAFPVSVSDVVTRLCASCGEPVAT